MMGRRHLKVEAVQKKKKNREILRVRDQGHEREDEFSILPNTMAFLLKS